MRSWQMLSEAAEEATAEGGQGADCEEGAGEEGAHTQTVLRRAKNSLRSEAAEPHRRRGQGRVEAPYRTPTVVTNR